MSFGFGFGPPRAPLRGRPLVAVRSLFAANEPGVWYDPSDLSTLFQDTAGTTPVTAVEQPVGLMLDKSKGLVLGPELVTNGDFSNGTTGWAVGSGWTWNNGIVDGASTDLAWDTALGVNKTYRLTFDIPNNSGQTVNVRLGGQVLAGIGAFTGTGTKAILFEVPAAGTTQKINFRGTASGFSLDNISVRELPGNHATQTTATSRPVLRQDGNGKHYLYFDGVDDGLATNTVTPGTDKAQVFAGVRKLSDAAATIFESSTSANANAGACNILSGNLGAGNTYQSVSRGTATISSTQAANINSVGFSPDTAVITATHDIAGDLSTIRRNGIAGTDGTSDKGTGNFLDYPLYIGRRGGTTLPFNGHLYSLIVRFGSNLPAATIEKIEKYVNTKTGAY